MDSKEETVKEIAPPAGSIEMTEMNVVKQATTVCLFQRSVILQMAGGFKWSPLELGAPTADNKDTLFDWQMENAGPKTVENFGGIDALVAGLQSNMETV